MITDGPRPPHTPPGGSTAHQSPAQSGRLPTMQSPCIVTREESRASPSVQAGSHVGWLQFWFRASADLKANNSLTWGFSRLTR